MSLLDLKRVKPYLADLDTRPNSRPPGGPTAPWAETILPPHSSNSGWIGIRTFLPLQSLPRHCGPVEPFETPRLFAVFRTLNQTISPTTTTKPPSMTIHVNI